MNFSYKSKKRREIFKKRNQYANRSHKVPNCHLLYLAGVFFLFFFLFFLLLLKFFNLKYNYHLYRNTNWVVYNRYPLINDKEG